MPLLYRLHSLSVEFIHKGSYRLLLLKQHVRLDSANKKDIFSKFFLFPPVPSLPSPLLPHPVHRIFVFFPSSFHDQHYSTSVQGEPETLTFHAATSTSYVTFVCNDVFSIFELYFWSGMKYCQKIYQWHSLLADTKKLSDTFAQICNVTVLQFLREMNN